ncbi:metallophosphoesterase family protein [Clostridium drakei]|uniref:Phosphoesterase n=1 Tax=Clostridium drakei TaxID=332101 RepID=A0A2U8DMY2_9CLOT|nr:metallophosphoesterase family protein [Clostridium drakei]AWI04099.1 YfcE family phosphodiesterase [Clostridium drakei]
MRIAVISDIHGNLEALKTAFWDIEERNADTIICLGDLTGYGPYPNEVIDFIREKRIISILGNYDAAVVEEKFNCIRPNEVNKFCMPWASHELTEENREYLKSLPQNFIVKFQHKEIVFVHGSNRDMNEYLKENSKEAEEAMKEFSGDVLVCAHTHIPYEKHYGDKILLNDGSIGKPKIGRPNGTYIILDMQNNNLNVEFIEFEYDYEKTAVAMEEKGIHLSCINNIRTGIE